MGRKQRNLKNFLIKEILKIKKLVLPVNNSYNKIFFKKRIFSLDLRQTTIKTIK